MLGRVGRLGAGLDEDTGTGIRQRRQLSVLNVVPPGIFTSCARKTSEIWVLALSLL